MPAQSSMHFYLNWAKERIDEMDATLASLESKVAEMGAESRTRAEQFIRDLRQKRTEFEKTVKKQGDEGGAAAKRQPHGDFEGLDGGALEGRQGGRAPRCPALGGQRRRVPAGQQLAR